MPSSPVPHSGTQMREWDLLSSWERAKIWKAMLNFTLTLKILAVSLPLKCYWPNMSHDQVGNGLGKNHFVFLEYPGLHDIGHGLRIILWSGVSIAGNCADC